MLKFDIQHKYIICNDKTIKDMKKKTISGYKKQDVINKFHDSIINQKIEETCNWFVELNSSGYNTDIWQEIIYIYGKNININNFNLLELICIKYKYYTTFTSSLDPKYIMHTRNNQEIRNLFINIILKITLSVKNDLFNKRTIQKICNTDFERAGILKNIKNSNLELIIDIVNENDIKEFKLAINEIAYHLVISKSLNNCIFWYQWIVKLDSRKKKDDIELSTNSRNIKNIDDKYKCDWVWLLWKLIFKITNNKSNNELLKNIKYLYELYRINYKSSFKSKKYYLLYFAFYCIISLPNFKKNQIMQEHLLIQASLNINIMYGILDYNLNKNSPEKIINKQEYINRIVNEMDLLEKKKIEKLEKKNNKKDAIRKTEEYETTNKLSYLHDLLFFKKEDKKKDKNILKYFKDDHCEKKIINL
jgi:hypothetical protein